MNNKKVYLIKAGLYVLADDVPDTDSLLDLIQNWGSQQTDDAVPDDIPGCGWVEEPKEVSLIQLPCPNRLEELQPYSKN
jgi:hypothetical protein